MSATVEFKPIRLRRIGGKKTVDGELLVESSTAYQVAVDGVVTSYYKDEWSPLVDFDSFSDVFGGLFK